MKYSIILAGLAVALLSSGCMSPYYAHRVKRQMVQDDTLAVQPLTVDDVIAMAKDSVSDDVILAQMNATHTYYRLSSSDIRDLKKSGVSNKVINAMIKSADQDKSVTQHASTAYYPDYYWSPYPYPYFYDPWYTPMYLGFSFRGGYHGGYRWGGGHGGFRGHHR